MASALPASKFNHMCPRRGAPTLHTVLPSRVHPLGAPAAPRKVAVFMPGRWTQALAQGAAKGEFIPRKGCLFHEISGVGVTLHLVLSILADILPTYHTHFIDKDKELYPFQPGGCIYYMYVLYNTIQYNTLATM